MSGVVGLGASPAAAQNTAAHAVTISAFYNDGMGGGGTDVKFSDADTDAMFAEANTLVTVADTPEDFACDHRLSRQGAVLGLHGLLTDGDINGDEELAYVMGAATFAKVVTRIRVCTRMVPNIGGCTPTGRLDTIVLAEWAAHGSLRGLLAAHEYGHAVNLPDEEFQLFNFMVMNGVPENRIVNQTQCSALRHDHLDADGPAIVSDVIIADSPSSFLIDGQAPSIERLAHSVFFQTAPIEVEDYYGQNDLNKLLDMLADEREAEFHPTIALLIGLLAGPQADREAAILADFVQRHPNSEGAHTAVGSLGYMAERGSNQALNLLMECALDQQCQYTASSVVGLALSGRTEARQVLSSLQRNARDVPRDALAAAVDAQREGAVYGPVGPTQIERGAVDTALAVNQQIASVGRRDYYRP